MTNEEVGLCSLPVTIPTDPEFSSLNLGAAVQVLSYELRMAAFGEAAAAPPTCRPSRPRMPTSKAS
jgi:rRNA methylase